MTILPWRTRAWILCTQRSGSTLLCGLLNAAVGITGDMDRRLRWEEHFNPDPKNCCFTWEDFVELDPIVTKMHVIWLAERGKIAPPEEPTKIIRLIRRDTTAQAWSFIMSSKTGQSHVHNIEQRLSLLAEEAKQTITRKEFYDFYNLIIRWNDMIGEIIRDVESRCVTVFYEDLIADRAKELTKIMEFLEMPSTCWHVPEDNEITTLAIHTA